jgi:DNA processing protein
MQINIRDLLVLTKIPGVGPGRLRALISHFKDPRAVAEASAKQLVQVEGIDRKTALSITNFFRDSGPSFTKRFLTDQLSRLNRANGYAVTIWDDRYPANLKKIYDPPPFLFVRGELNTSDQHSVAIVGTRHPSPYGIQMAERFASDLAKLGLSIISGLARGIDTHAHAATLKADGRTVAVIGSGVDVIYPPENKQLADRIIEHGAIISEFLMGAKPDAGNFPRRNRIISGIAVATIIVETGIDGGAMITAATALDQNREVFAIPGAAGTKVKSGTNQLIKEGRAKLVETIDDVLAELQPQLRRHLRQAAAAEPRPPADLSLFERKLYDALGDEPVHIDVLAAQTGMTTSDALVQLLSLEFKGAVRQTPGKMFRKL